MSLTVYADFTSPACYVASQYADALVAAEVAVDWRAVQAQPELPVTGRPLSEAEESATGRRFAELAAILAPDPAPSWSMPRMRPRTEAAVSAYAETYPSGVAADVRRLLFELYWRDGADIGSPTALRTPLAGPVLRAGVGADSMRQAGFAVSVTGGPVTSAAHRRIRDWRSEWLELGAPALPVVLVDGATLVELDAVRRLRKEVGYAGAELVSAPADPRRFPAVAGAPSPAWVSRIGGRWRHLYQLPAAG